MNYQLLIESYSLGVPLSKQEVDLLIIELDTQILNLEINKEPGFLKTAPEYICKRLHLRKDTYWISCLAEVIDKNRSPERSKTRGATVIDALLSKGLVVG